MSLENTDDKENPLSFFPRLLKLKVDRTRWLAKVNFFDDEGYGPRELIEIGKAMSKIAGVQCAWPHPHVQSSFSLMVRFFPGEVPTKKFFHPSSGYSNWISVNNVYQASNIHLVRGWSRALLDFRGGMHCRESHRRIARRYQKLPGVRSVYLDPFNDCRFTYQIVVAFDRKIMNPGAVK